MNWFQFSLLSTFSGFSNYTQKREGGKITHARIYARTKVFHKDADRLFFYAYLSKFVGSTSNENAVNERTLQLRTCSKISHAWWSRRCHGKHPEYLNAMGLLWMHTQLYIRPRPPRSTFCPLVAIMEEVLGKIAQFPPYTRGTRFASNLSSLVVFDTFSKEGTGGCVHREWT